MRKVQKWVGSLHPNRQIISIAFFTRIAKIAPERSNLQDLPGHDRRGIHRNQARLHEIERTTVRFAVLGSLTAYIARRPAIFTLRGKPLN